MFFLVFFELDGHQGTSALDPCSFPEHPKEREGRTGGVGAGSDREGSLASLSSEQSLLAQSFLKSILGVILSSEWFLYLV